MRNSFQFVVMRRTFVTVLYLLSFCLLACGTSRTMMVNSASPLRIADDESLRLVAVSDVITDMSVDEKIGHGHQGLINLVNDTFYASKISEAHSLILTSLEEELREAGYRIEEKNRSLFYADTTDVLKTTELLVGGKIVSCKYNRYSSVASKKSTAEATVHWQLLDRRKNAVVFEKQTSGSAKGPEKACLH